MRLAAEFFVEPFAEGSPGEHVMAAVAAVESTGLSVEFGPFGNLTDGDHEAVIGAVTDAVRAALESGASRVNVTLVRLDDA